MSGWFNWVRLLLLFYAAQTEDMETPKKPRILCLHGHGSNAAKLKEHFNNWPDYVLDKMDLVFIDGPFSINDATLEVKLFEWFTLDKDKKTYENFGEGIAYIEDQMLKLGPFDGVLGFSQSFKVLDQWQEVTVRSVICIMSCNTPISQGAIVTGALPGMQEHGACLTKVGKIKHVIIISGAKLGGKAFPLPKFAESAFSSPINIPSLHIFGETDVARPNAPELVEAYVDHLVILHSGGHEVPKLDEEGLKIVFEFLKKINAIV